MGAASRYPPVMKISTLLALALALLVPACDSGFCAEEIASSTSTTTDDAVTSEPTPAPELGKMGDHCDASSECEDAKWSICIKDPFAYCSRQCGTGFPETDCSIGDHGNHLGNWTRYTCDVWPGGSTLCTEHFTQEPYDGP